MVLSLSRIIGANITPWLLGLAESISWAEILAEDTNYLKFDSLLVPMPIGQTSDQCTVIFCSVL